MTTENNSGLPVKQAKGSTLLGWTLLCFLPLASVTHAEELTWDLFRKHALQRSPDIQGLDSVKSSRESAMELAEAQRGPEISAFTRAVSSSDVWQQERQPGQVPTFGLRLNQNLYDLINGDSRVSRAATDLEIAETQGELGTVDFVQRLKLIYVDLVYRKNRGEALLLIVKRQRENLDIVRLKYKSGLENEGALVLAESYLQQAEADQELNSKSLKLAASLLETFSGLKLKDLTMPSQYPTQWDTAGTGKAPTHADIHLAQLQVKAAELDRVLAAEKFGPSLQFETSYGQLIPGDRRKGTDWEVAVGINVPLFTNGRKPLSLREKDEDIRTAQFEETKVQRNLTENLERAKLAIEEKESQLKVNRRLADAAKFRSYISRNRYNSSLTSFENWIQSESEWMASLKNDAEISKDLQIAQANYSRFKGDH